MRDTRCDVVQGLGGSRNVADRVYCAQICIWDWQTGVLLASAAGSTSSVLAVKWNPVQYCSLESVESVDNAWYCLVTCGVGHVKFWTLHRPAVEASDVNTPASPARAWVLDGGRGTFSRSAEMQDAISLEFMATGGTRRAVARPDHNLAHSASASKVQGGSARRPDGAAPGGTPGMVAIGSGMHASLPSRRTLRGVASTDNIVAGSGKWNAEMWASPREESKRDLSRSTGPMQAWCISGMVRGDVYVWKQPLVHPGRRSKHSLRSQDSTASSACPFGTGGRVMAVMKVRPT